MMNDVVDLTDILTIITVPL